MDAPQFIEVNSLTLNDAEAIDSEKLLVNVNHIVAVCVARKGPGKRFYCIRTVTGSFYISEEEYLAIFFNNQLTL